MKCCKATLANATVLLYACQSVCLCEHARAQHIRCICICNYMSETATHYAVIAFVNTQTRNPVDNDVCAGICMNAYDRSCVLCACMWCWRITRCGYVVGSSCRRIRMRWCVRVCIALGIEHVSACICVCNCVKHFACT